MEKTSLLVSPLRLSGHPYLFLHSFLLYDTIELVHKSAEDPSADQFPPQLKLQAEKITSQAKIFEFLWKKGKLSQKKGYTFQPESKDFLQIFKIYESLNDLLNNPSPMNPEKLKSVVDSLNLLEIQESWLQDPVLSIILYEMVIALQALDSHSIANPLTKFIRFIEITQLYQGFIFKPENLLRKIGPFLPNPLEAIKAKINENLATIIDFAGLSSALYTYQQDHTVFWDHIPISAFPTMQVKKAEVDNMREKSLIWNKLFDRMVRRIDIFEKVFNELAQVDMFVSRLWKISQRKKEINKTQGLEFCIFRNDYLRDGVLDQWKQVEFNAIAVSFGYMSDCTQKLHHVVYNQIFNEFNKGKQLACLPEASMLLADGLAHAHHLYAKVKKTKILFVVGASEGNILDQRGLELLLGYRGVLALRKTFNEIIKEIKINKEDNALFIGEQEISVVYFRHGYIPNHYQDEDHWKIREMMEMSKAIKCPSVEFQLINFKKIQEVLQRKDILPQLLDTPEEIEKIREDFVQLWSLDTVNEQTEAFALVKSKPDDYVLKPQREGGGNNTYGVEILEKFKSQHATSELKAYILMKRIKPTPRPGFMLKKRQLNVEGVISEFGVFSYLISEEKALLESKYGGYLLRTKNFETDEGGVATGYSVLDSLVYEEKD